jgi:hypothetical protein
VEKIRSSCDENVFDLWERVLYNRWAFDLIFGEEHNYGLYLRESTQHDCKLNKNHKLKDKIKLKVMTENNDRLGMLVCCPLLSGVMSQSTYP